MSSRISAVRTFSKSLKGKEQGESARLSSQFESRVFDRKAQELFLPQKIVLHLEEVRAGKVRFDTSYADVIADALKSWATKQGATHYTHWFQPLTGIGAEKQDSFLAWDGEGGAIERLKGRELLLGEPDASSLPSGGLRVTHAARGYTSWDPASLPFLWEAAEGLTLCIPALFFSWKGEALDHKIPLLRSDQKLCAVALRLLALCGEKATQVFSTLGAEQEYFLIDRELYLLRPDLILAGRTVFGAKPSKGQELEDHYFGPLKERVIDFMREFEAGALKLGIPVKTRHNEVAPAQHEVAPLFEKASVACDHNTMLMELMRQAAGNLGLACLLHEKPFAGINGSGKHNNWSLATDTGINLLNPKAGSLLFLTLLTAILRGVHEHAALLRASIASAGNDHRLGGSEAPPTILSVFLGDALEKIVTSVVEGKEPVEEQARKIDLGLHHLPLHDADASDRNRTSFFAFTGNKFEFRAVGSSASCAWPITTINAIVADSLALILDEIADAVKDRKNLSEKKRLELALPVLRKHLKGALPVCFSGDGYSKLWHEEAEKRGLPNIQRSFHAFELFGDKKTIRIFEEILSEHELESRSEIAYEQYAKQMAVETNVMLELFATKVLPAGQKDLYTRAAGLRKLGQMGVSSKAQAAVIERLSEVIDSAIEAAEKLDVVRGQAADLGWEAKARVYCEVVAPKMLELRGWVDRLETLIDDELWPLPKYRELLFLV